MARRHLNIGKLFPEPFFRNSFLTGEFEAAYVLRVYEGRDAKFGFRETLLAANAPYQPYSQELMRIASAAVIP